MKVWIVSLLLMCSKNVLSDGDSLLSPCDMTDIGCLSKSTTKFLEQTHRGDARYNFVAIDPLNIASSEVNFEESAGVIYKFKNIVVTGLKDQSISDFKMDTSARSVILTTKADLKMVADIAIELTKSAKKLAGTATVIGSVLGTATYNYELLNDSNGVQHFEVGPETITCSVVKTPESQLNTELFQALYEDDGFKKLSKEKVEELRSKAFCEIVKESYKSVIHNIRAAAKLLPASAFFKDIE